MRMRILPATLLVLGAVACQKLDRLGRADDALRAAERTPGRTLAVKMFK